MLSFKKYPTHEDYSCVARTIGAKINIFPGVIKFYRPYVLTYAMELLFMYRLCTFAIYICISFYALIFHL